MSLGPQFGDRWLRAPGGGVVTCHSVPTLKLT